MSRYKNNARLEREEQEIVELENKVVPIPDDDDKPQVIPQVQASDEEETFKKRYGDLRRYNQQIITDKDNRIKELEEKLSRTTVDVPQAPKTKEELDAWKNKYPEVFGHIMTMILDSNKEFDTKYQEGLEKVKKIEDKIKRDEAVAELNRLHPDFFKTIVPDPKFKEWVESQPVWIVDALNGWDAIGASRAIDLYKADMHILGKPKKNASQQREAAESVTRTTSSAPDTSSEKPRFSESQVDKMSAREFERLEDQIMDAMRSGRFDYDVTGAAR